MPKRIFRIEGKTINQQGTGVPNLRVEAWDKDLLLNDFLGSAVTDAEGKFIIEFSTTRFRDLFFLDRLPDVFFIIYSGDKKLTDKRKTVIRNLKEKISNVTIEVDPPVEEKTAEKGAEYLVKGTVLRQDQQPFAEAVVRAVDKDLRHEQSLGQTITNDKGYYEIHYTRNQFRRAEKQRADLIVRAYDPETGQLLLDESDIIFNAGPVEEVDLTAKTSYSEYERHMAELTPVCDGVPAAELTEKDIHFLHGETDITAQHIEFLSIAPRLAKQTEMPPEIFYGLFRQNLPTQLSDLIEKDVAELHKALLASFKAHIIPLRFQKDLDDYLERLSKLQKTDPGVHRKKEKEKLRCLLKVDDLDGVKVDTVVEKAGHAALVNDKLLKSMVEADELTDLEAKSLGLTVTLNNLLDDNLKLVKHLKTGTFSSIPEGRIRHVQDLIAFEKPDWLDILEKEEIQPPDGWSREGYAALMTKKIENLYPTKTMMTRVISKTPDNISRDLNQLHRLFERNDKLFSKSFDDLDVSGLDESTVESLRVSHNKLKGLANTYPGLDLHSILNDPDPQITADAKDKKIRSRIETITRFYDQNADKELLFLDYSPESSDIEGLDFGGFDEAGKNMVLKTVKAYQRIYTVTRDCGHTRKLLAFGYHSLFQIANISSRSFMTHTGLDEIVAMPYHFKACHLAAKSVSGLFGLIAKGRAIRDAFPFDNTDPAVADYLKKMDGWEDLFDSLDYCNCEHCRSIFGPAAYFVDLMRYIQTNILEQFPEAEAHELHVLHLKSRRPDLWKLPLTCRHTSQLIPYLDIINEVLENFIALSLGFEELQIPAPGESDRSGVEKHVYGALQNATDSFSLPFSLPLARLELYLSHFELKRGDIAEVLGLPDGIRAAARLNLSKEREYELIINSNTVLRHLEMLYGLNFYIDNDMQGLAFHDPAMEPGDDEYTPSKNDVQILLKAMDLARNELGQLIDETQFVLTGGYRFAIHPEHIWIKAEKRRPFGENASVQNDIERIYGLTAVGLDRMHRFIRLWRKLPWTIKELDTVLRRLTSEELADGIDESTLPCLADILSIQKRFGLTVEAVCGLWSNIPDFSVINGGESLFDRMFNLPDFVRLDGEYPKSTEYYLHPAFRDTPPDEQEYSTYRLTAGLNIDDQTLYLLICGLGSEADINPLGITDLDSDNLDDRKFTLSLLHLSLLYRHAFLVKKLNLAVPDLFRLIALADTIEGRHIDSLNDLTALLEFYDWWKSTSYTLDDLECILLLVEENRDVFTEAEANREKEAETVRNEMVAKIHADQALLFNHTVFAFAEGVTEEQSEKIIAENTGAIVKAPGIRFRCTDAFFAEDFEEAHLDLDTPSSISADIDDDIQTLLLTYATESRPVFDDTLFTAVADITEDESRAIVATNPSWIEREPLDDAYWLTPSYHPAELIIPDKIPLPKKRANTLLATYETREIISNYLAAGLGMPVEKVKALIGLAGADLSEIQYISALQEGDSNERLKELVKEVLSLKTLFKNPTMDAAAIEYIQTTGNVIGNIAPDSISIENIRLLALFARFLEKFKDTDDGLQDYISLLSKYNDSEKRFYTDSAERDPVKEVLSQALDAEPGLALTAHDEIRRLEEALAAHYPETEDLGFPDNPLDALAKLQDYTDLSRQLGVDGKVLAQIVSNDYDELNHASNALLGAFRAKYSNEEKWQETIEPFENKIRGRKRDALADYLIHAHSPKAFGNMNDLYHHFLLDVELEGCARTSRLVAANCSLQLYVHRVMMHLEQDEKETIDLTLNDDAIKEWEWRKNYRVWEANRKVFLYPENYLEPDLRDNKTPLFEELESTLLQQEINEDTVLGAYAKYMRGFEEVANLKIAGSYHDINSDAKSDFLHLFGVTADDPIVYYYRVVENAYHGEQDDAKGIVWHPWRKIDVQIPVRKVSPIVFNGRLYVFWVEITTKPENSDFEGGGSFFIGYKHTMSLKFTKLMLDGSWSAPVKVTLVSKPFDTGEGVVEDLLLDEYLSTKVLRDGRVFLRILPRYGTAENEHISKKENTLIEEGITNTNVDRESAGERQLTEEEGLTLIRRLAKFEPCDGYSLKGFQWERVYPHPRYYENSIIITGRNFRMRSRIDFYRSALGQRDLYNGYEIFGRILGWKRENNVLYCGMPPSPLRGWLDPYPFASVLIDQRNTDYYGGLDFALWGTDYYPGVGSGAWGEEETKMVKDSLYQYPVARNINPAAEISVINGSVNDGLLDTEGDLLYFQASPVSIDYVVRRIGTTVSDDAASILFSGGVDALLSLETQEALKEASLPVDLEPDCFVIDKTNAGELDFKGPSGVYFGEIFFHIPFLIANHLNSKGKYAEAQKWYHYIYNPTAKSAGEIPPTDRNWRYLEFRQNTITSLRKQLTDKDAIETYKNDPFSPHAIARLEGRFGAYQKAVVMKYIDNLLDWGDSLFEEDTMESINEATLLYVLAADILGERPAELGDCSEESALTYDYISKFLNTENEFLIELFHSVQKQTERPKDTSLYTLAQPMTDYAQKTAKDHVTMLNYVTYSDFVPEDAGDAESTTDVTGSAFSGGTDAIFLGDAWKHKKEGTGPQYIDFMLSLGSLVGPAFCIPENTNLMGYWDRVEDRLFKIRNCMNISGVRRELSLFAPEIDPMLLVRAKAAGLSLEDVLNSISGNLPPYRFSYIIERAKGYAAMLQGLGSALLSALEKKDVENLNQMRTAHQQNILKQTRQIRQWEIDAASEACEALRKRKETVEYRTSYYKGLIDDSLMPWEKIQERAIHTTSVLRGTAATLDVVAAVLLLVIDSGSPVAMKWGGTQLGKSGYTYAESFRDLALISDSVASSAGLIAGFKRREQGWEHKKSLADYELNELENQIKAAEIRLEIANRAIEIHDKNVEQLDEVYEFYQNKFTNLGLYTWLSTNLQRLYRQAYNNAYAMAKLAEQAYRFERGDDAAELIGPSHWDASKSGLLAGERLLMDLQNLERKFLETNYRTIEIDQAFSLTQIDPAALIELKQTGSCQFTIAEIYFDLFYPGHYRRKIKAVRLTIPCITGPYTNVSASLRLTGSEIRKEPDLKSNLLQVPLTRTVAIATSTAQNDAGVFELNFRDERYMPFEGAGAVSQWELSLPKNFRQFDYNTINDVILHISYTAEEDSSLRIDVEDELGTLEGAIFEFLSNREDPQKKLKRIFSFRQEFSSAFSTLLNGPINQSVTIELTEKHFPIFLKGRPLVARSAFLVLGTKEDQSLGTFQLTFNNNSLVADPDGNFQLNSNFGDLFTADVRDFIPDDTLPDRQMIKNPIGKYSIAIENSGSLALDDPAPSHPSAIDSEKLNDIYLYIEYDLV